MNYSFINNTTGDVGIGTASPGYKLDVQNGGSSTVNINTNGTVQASAGVLTSDQMFKIDIDSLHNALATIKQLKPKSYYFDTVNYNGEGKFNFQSVKQYGFIAQDVEQLLPELVVHSIKSAITDTLGNIVNPSYTYRALNYNGFISILTKGIQELQQKNDSLQSKANNQDSINNLLQNQVNQLTVNNTSLQNQLNQSQNQINQLVANDTSLQNQLNQLLTVINACCAKNSTRSMQTTGSSETQSQSFQQIDVKLNDVQSVVLLQNIPNPFQEQTTINYILPDNTAKAQMLFYNEQGKLIQSVELVQKGKGQLNVFANDLTNGIYTYSLVVDGQIIDTKKMVKSK